MIKKSSKRSVNFCNTFESQNDGPRAVFIKAKMNDNKFIAVTGVYISPSNKNQSLEEVDNFITSSFLLANANYQAIVGDFNVNLDLNAKLGRKDRNKMKQIMT